MDFVIVQSNKKKLSFVSFGIPSGVVHTQNFRDSKHTTSTAEKLEKLYLKSQNSMLDHVCVESGVHLI